MRRPATSPQRVLAVANSRIPAGGGGGTLPAASPSSPSPVLALDLRTVDPQVLAAAQPFLTGNPDADNDIIRFYVAKQQLLQKLQAGRAQQQAVA